MRLLEIAYSVIKSQIKQSVKFGKTKNHISPWVFFTIADKSVFSSFTLPTSICNFSLMFLWEGYKNGEYIEGLKQIKVNGQFGNLAPTGLANL